MKIEKKREERKRGKRLSLASRVGIVNTDRIGWKSFGDKWEKFAF